MSIGGYIVGRKRKSNLSLRWMPYRLLYYFSPEEEKKYISILKSINLERPKEVKIHSNEILITQAIGSYKFNELELMSIKESIKNETIKLIGKDYKINITLVGNDE